MDVGAAPEAPVPPATEEPGREFEFRLESGIAVPGITIEPMALI
jgi:hypothetical protein